MKEGRRDDAIANAKNYTTTGNNQLYYSAIASKKRRKYGSDFVLLAAAYVVTSHDKSDVRKAGSFYYESHKLLSDSWGWSH